MTEPTSATGTMRYAETTRASLDDARLAEGRASVASKAKGALHFRFLLLTSLFLLFGACGHSQLVPVSGQVTLDEEPVSDIVVNFQPILGETTDASFSPSSSGITDAEGRYKLRTSEQAGAVAGKHVVTLIYKDAVPPDAEELFLQNSGDRKWQPAFKLSSNARDGTLTFTVPEGGTDEANFAFQSPPAQPATQAYGRH